MTNNKLKLSDYGDLTGKSQEEIATIKAAIAKRIRKREQKAQKS